MPRLHCPLVEKENRLRDPVEPLRVRPLPCLAIAFGQKARRGRFQSRREPVPSGRKGLQ